MEEKNQNNMANMVQLTDTRLDCISIEIAKDSMSADIVIDITGISMRDFSPTMIYNVITNSKLNEEMVNFSLIKEVVDEVTNRKKKVLPINQVQDPSESIVRQQIANGIQIVHGIDGWVKFYHPHNQRVVIKEDGSADFRNLEKFISIKKAEKIATLFAGVPGKPGKDVFGAVLNAPAIKRPKITIGANIITTNNSSPEEPEKIYIEYTSACDGVLFSTDESVTVTTNDYKFSEMGGIKDLEIVVTNNTDYTLDNVRFEITYIKKNGGVWKNKEIDTDMIGSKSYMTIKVPDTDRGTSVRCRVISVESSVLGL